MFQDGEGYYSKLFKSVAAEFLCTLIFIFTICSSALSVAKSDPGNAGNVTAGVCTGFVSVALIFGFGSLSGAHFNPAITVGALVGGKIAPIKGVLFIAVQLLAGVIASACLHGLYDDISALSISPESNVKAFFMEAILTFILVLVVWLAAFGNAPHYKMEHIVRMRKLSSARLRSESRMGSSKGDDIGSPRSISVRSDQNDFIEIPTEKKEDKCMGDFDPQLNTGNKMVPEPPSVIDDEMDLGDNYLTIYFAPFPIGLTLGFLAFLGGPISGGFYNPARAFGPALVNSMVGNNGHWTDSWVYYVGELLGAVAASLVAEIWNHG